MSAVTNGDEGWDGARRILCLRLDSVGDVLMTSPALRALQHGRADRHVTLCTSMAGARVAPLIPYVDDVLVYEAPWMKATAAGGADAHRLTIARLRRGLFDAAVIFTVYSQSPLPAALLCFEAGIPRRLAHCRENPYQLLTDWVREPEPERLQRHEVRRQLDLVASVGARTAQETIALRLPRGSRRTMRRRLRGAGITRTSGGFVAMHPGASAPSRRYPADGFVAAGRTLAARGHRVVVVGARDEAPLADDVARRIGPAAVSFAGRTTLVELAALLSLARVVVANNSGPMHVAAAVGTPTVALYALTNPQHTPWGTPARVLSHDVDCRWCYRSVCPAGHHACLRRISPDAIVAAVDALQTASDHPAPAMEARG